MQTMPVVERIARLSAIVGVLIHLLIILSLFPLAVQTFSGPGAGESSGWEAIFSSLFTENLWGKVLLPAIVCPLLLYAGGWWLLVTQKKKWWEAFGGGVLLLNILLVFLGFALHILVYLASFLSDYETTFFPAFWLTALAFLPSLCCSLVLGICLLHLSSARTDHWLESMEEAFSGSRVSD